MHDVSDPGNVLNCDQQRQQQLATLLKPYGIDIKSIDDDATISGSFFGEREAGLIAHNLYLRNDTPVHSALHEAGHYICMEPDRRAKLNTDAAGDYDEENGVCYLQILLADHLSNMSKDRMMIDMDRWGYTFRLGSSKKWFERDAEDAKQWLINHNIITIKQQLTWQYRIS